MSRSAISASGGRSARTAAGSGGVPDGGIGGIAGMAAGGAAAGAGAARSDHLPAQPPAVPGRFGRLGQRPRPPSSSSPSPTRRPSTRSCACSATRAPRPSSGPARRGCIEILGPGTAIYHVNILSFAFRLPGHAEPDPPAMIDADRRGVPRAHPLRRRADRHPHRHRAEGARPRQPRRGPARDALGGPGQPRLAHRLVVVRPQERRGAPPRLPAALRPQARARRRGPARAALPAQGHARHRRLRQRRGAAALDPSRSSARSRPASSSSSPRRPRWSRR